jgi:hypothetical protein
MISNSIELFASTLQTIQKIIDIENLEETTIQNISGDLREVTHREFVITNLETLAYSIEEVLQEIDEFPYLINLLPSLKEKTCSVRQIAEHTTDMTIHSIAKLCCIKGEDSVDSSQRPSIEKRLERIAKIHLQRSPHQKRLLNHILASIQSLSKEDQLDWPSIDRLTWVFFTFEQVQREFLQPECKKNR